MSLLPAFLLAAQVSTTVEPAALSASAPLSSSANGDIQLWPVISGLILVLGLILGCAWLLRRLGQGGFSLQSSPLKVVASLQLGTRERAVMIEVGGQQLLLGVAPGRVNTLHVFPSPVVETKKPRSFGDYMASQSSKPPQSESPVSDNTISSLGQTK